MSIVKVSQNHILQQGDFLSATLGSRPSYAWRSILFGRELLQEGIRHRVGNGSSTRVWLDKWIEDPDEGLRAPWIKNYSFDVNLRAADLINVESSRWDVSKLAEIFVLADVEIIMKNQPVVNKEDFVSWRFNKSGQISVKSAYWLAADMKMRMAHPQAFALPSLNDLIEKAWKVQTSPKLRIFIWKALSDALPTSDLIIGRGMKVDGRCQICGDEGESINHMLFICPFARQVWALSPIPHPREGFSTSSVFANFEFLFNIRKSRNLQSEEGRVWPWVVWNLWKRRNDFLFENRCFNPLEVSAKAFRDAEEWFVAQTLEKEWKDMEKITQPVPERRWHPPKPGWKMCNVGFTFDNNKRIAGGGWVLRNERGVVLLHSRRSFAGIKTKDEARFEVLLGAAESMKSHKQTKIPWLVNLVSSLEQCKGQRRGLLFYFRARR